jgi:hypothetical protein
MGKQTLHANLLEPVLTNLGYVGYRVHLGVAGGAEPAVVLGQSGGVQRGNQAFLMVRAVAVAIAQDDVIVLRPACMPQSHKRLFGRPLCTAGPL